MVIYKSDLSAKLAKKLGIKTSEADKLIKSFEEVIAESLEEGDSIRTSLGTFSTREVKGYTRYNTLVGRNVTVPTKRTVTFKVSANLKRRVN